MTDKTKITISNIILRLYVGRWYFSEKPTTDKHRTRNRKMTTDSRLLPNLVSAMPVTFSSPASPANRLFPKRSYRKVARGQPAKEEISVPKKLASLPQRAPPPTQETYVPFPLYGCCMRWLHCNESENGHFNIIKNNNNINNNDNNNSNDYDLYLPDI